VTEPHPSHSLCRALMAFETAVLAGSFKLDAALACQHRYNSSAQRYSLWAGLLKRSRRFVRQCDTASESSSSDMGL
jgi:hypothetical protein